MAQVSINDFQHYEIGEKDFHYLQQLVYREAGINLTDAKKCLVQTRIGKLMRRHQIDGYKSLFTLLDSDHSGKTLEMVLDAISTNHTFFFREDSHFTYLSQTIVPDLVRNHQKRNIRIWSAASSSGEEPYSIAITMMEALKTYPGVSFSLYASDISVTVLDKAKKGIYPLEEIQYMPDTLQKKYFQKGKDQFAHLVKIKNSVKELVTFARHNLLEPLQSQEDFDIVFCRNVMIYFDNPTKERIVALISSKMKKNAYFINGHSESLGAIKHPFKMVQPTIYINSNG
ncbi:protein-glutamate O-methyltransferase CheR [bacterium]|nr:MAG: protein-glutamate O-methyltransferase CheR [bacterium]